MEKINGKSIGIIIGVVAVIAFFVWFIANSNTAEYKYGREAVDDAKAAILAADQYLDRKMDARSYDRQINLCDKYRKVDSDDKGKDIYFIIQFMSNTSTDYDVLKRRNELAELIGEKKR